MSKNNFNNSFSRLKISKNNSRNKGQKLNLSIKTQSNLDKTLFVIKKFKDKTRNNKRDDKCKVNRTFDLIKYSSKIKLNSKVKEPIKIKNKSNRKYRAKKI